MHSRWVALDAAAAALGYDPGPSGNFPYGKTPVSGYQ
jgi:hypothetical protein